jgi:hypothetical protein
VCLCLRQYAFKQTLNAAVFIHSVEAVRHVFVTFRRFYAATASGCVQPGVDKDCIAWSGGETSL